MSPQASSDSRWKVPYLSETLLNSSRDTIPFISITESWLKGYIADAQLIIPNYSVYRCDRSKRIRGGALLYIHSSLLVSDVATFDDGICEVVICSIESLNMITASIYRPPDASSKSFKKIIELMETYLDQKNPEDKNTIYLTGDLNFPNMNWESHTFTRNLGLENAQCCEITLEFMSKYFLTQIVDKPTRGDNLLDIVLTNAARNNVIEVSSTKTCLSDHNLVGLRLGYNFLETTVDNKTLFHPEKYTFHSLDTQSGDVQAMNSQLANINWELLYSLCPEDDGSSFTELIRLTVLQLTIMHCPEKKLPTTRAQGSRIQSTLHHKRRKIKSRLYNVLPRSSPSRLASHPSSQRQTQLPLD